jgi:L,D-transpeptidase catalytic domain/Putative peptidoglycan binding domain
VEPKRGYNPVGMRRRVLVAGGILLTLGGVALSAGGAYAYYWDRGRADLISPGVRIAGFDVGGLRAAQARDLLARRLVLPLQEPIRLRAHGRSFVVRPRRAGMRVEVAKMVHAAVVLSRRGGLVHRLLRDFHHRRVDAAVRLQAGFSSRSLTRFVRHVAKVVDRPAHDAEVVPSSTSLQIVPSRDGVAVRRDVLLRSIAKRLLRLKLGRTLAIPTKPVRPRWTTANIAQRYPAYILVDRGAFTLRFYENLQLYKTYPIAVGQAGLETPSGLYTIDDKQVNPSWHVPKSAWAGDLAGRVIPPGPDDPIKARWMGFWNGAGIHGTEETWSIGHAASHGCIRMSIPDVIELYDLVPYDTPIYVG